MAVRGDGRWYWCWGFFKVCLVILVEKWGIGFGMCCVHLWVQGIRGGGRGFEICGEDENKQINRRWSVILSIEMLFFIDFFYEMVTRC